MSDVAQYRVLFVVQGGMWTGYSQSTYLPALENVELLIHFKISKTAPTCFGLQGNHHQGATVST